MNVLPDPTREEHHHVSIAAVVEETMQENVRCEMRDGEAYFVFWVTGKRQSVVPADEYLAALKRVRENPGRWSRATFR